MKLTYMVAAEYVSLDRQGRPIVVGIYDRVIVESSGPSNLLIGVLARVEDIMTPEELQSARWLFDGPGSDDHAEFPMTIDNFMPSPMLTSTYLTMGVGLVTTNVGEIRIQIAVGDQVFEGLTIPVLSAEEVLS